MALNNTKKPILIFEHQAFDAAFQALYDSGMSLIEETAAYIDGDGVFAARQLSGEASALYASEAMRLSIRLMQVASWLLLMRAGREKEMPEDQISNEKAKVSLNTPSDQTKNEYWQELPKTFRDLVNRSLRLEERVRHLDTDLTLLMEESAENSVSDQLNRIKSAFLGQ